VAVARVRSVWAALLLAARNDNLRSVLEIALRHNLEPDLLVLDQATLTEVMWLLAELGMWNELGHALARYRQATGTSGSGWSRTGEQRFADVLEVLQIVQMDKPKGIALLRGLCEQFEMTRSRDAVSIGAYLMVLRLLCFQVADDPLLQDKVANIESFYSLVPG